MFPGILFRFPELLVIFPAQSIFGVIWWSTLPDQFQVEIHSINNEISAIAKFSTKQLKEVTYLQTKDLGLQLIDTDRERKVSGSVVRALRENRIIFIECDEIEKWKQSQKEKMTFLGETIGVDKTINLIHRRTGAEVVFGLLHRFSLQKYRLIIESCEDMLSKLGKTRKWYWDTL